MEIKKTPKADLENKKLTFTLIGLVVTLAVVWFAFEIRSYDKRSIDHLLVAETVETEEMVEITKQEQPKPKMEAPKPQVTKIEVVEDDVEVEDEIEIDVDVDQDTEIEEYTPPEIEDEEIEEAEIFTVVESMPEFPGGPAKMMEYIGKNIKYPMMAREAGIEGRVFVNFVVEPDGSISHVKVLRPIGGGCDEEAVRVIESMPKWNPGKQRGTAVRVSFNLPVKFKLQ